MTRQIQKYVVLALASIFLSGCVNREVKQTMLEVEAIIDERPAEALSIISEIDSIALTGRAVKAKYSLLQAMALDKNYIDTADTRIVQPAVDWYSRHGNPEEKLKAWMYLGIEQFNGQRYNEAIVSLYRAGDYASKVSDQNLLGILYAITSDTYTKTEDYVQASYYIDKSIECFHQSGRKDQEDKERVRKVLNLIQLREWEEADASFQALLSDSSLSASLKNRVKIDYAQFLLSPPIHNDSLANILISEALSDGGVLRGTSQWFSYAYLLSSVGKKEGSEAIWDDPVFYDRKNNYDYYYWKHREKLLNNDYKGAYSLLWSAMQSRDSLIRESFYLSASNSQRLFLEKVNRERSLIIQNKNKLISIIVLFLLIAILLAGNIRNHYKRKNQSLIEDNDRQEMAVALMRSEMDKMEKHLSKESIEKERAKFAFLADIYDNYYRAYSSDLDSDDRLNRILRSKIGDLRSSPDARDSFEKLIDKEMGGKMTRFRRDFPDLSDKEYCMASYIFAGFDNTLATVIMNVSSVDNYRKMKSRLKSKISNSEIGNKEDYLRLF
ncbi:MAG: hypothetical protein K6F06_01085 [Bacteroidales bacterium]|nr:hypothetical protein [Bacteroidales bacterium]